MATLEEISSGHVVHVGLGVGSSVSFAIRSVLRGALVSGLATVGGCHDEPPSAQVAEPSDVGESAVVTAAPGPAPALALGAVLARGIRAPQGDEASYEVDPFVAALIVETLRAEGAAVFVWTPAEETASAGYRIETVAPGSVWAQLGLQPGDVVEALNGVALTGPDAVEPALDGAEHQVTLTVFRDDLSFTARYRLEGGLAWRNVLSGIGPASEPEVVDASGGVVEEVEDPSVAPTPAAQPRARPRPSTRRPSPSKPKAPPRASPASGSSGSKTSDIRCASANACTITKRTFDTLVSSPKKLQQQANIVPAIRNDVHSGYKLKRVTSGSAISKLGFRAGDKITHVNGRFLGDDAQAMALYFALGSTRVFKIRYERGGAKRAKTVTVR